MITMALSAALRSVTLIMVAGVTPRSSNYSLIHFIWCGAYGVGVMSDPLVVHPREVIFLPPGLGSSHGFPP